jgi:hypothetical protein
MSVVLTRTCVDGGQGKPCNCCGEKVYPPYLIWRCEADILICGECAERIRDGFIADLIHRRSFQKTAATTMPLEHHGAQSRAAWRVGGGAIAWILGFRPKVLWYQCVGRYVVPIMKRAPSVASS